MNLSKENTEHQKTKNKAMFKSSLTVILLLITTVLVAGGYLIGDLLQIDWHKSDSFAPVVTATGFESTFEQIHINVMGTVVPASEMELKAEVSGRIIGVHKGFELGSCVVMGEKLLIQEPVDYQLVLAAADGRLADAAYDLAIEESKQEIARQEWERNQDKATVSEQDQTLLLRKPHLTKVQAEYNAAKAKKIQAELDLQRTILYAPFNAVVTKKTAEPGGYLSALDSVASLVNTDHFWVQLAVPVEQLDWIDIPQQAEEEGSLVQISFAGKQKLGRVCQLLSELREDSHMASVLVDVFDPLDLKKPKNERQPLLLGEYVQAEIEGSLIENVVSIPRVALHDGNQVWLADAQQRLQIATVDVVWHDEKRVLLKNTLPPDTRLVTSNLEAPAPGMQLQIEEPRLVLNSASQP